MDWKDGMFALHRSGPVRVLQPSEGRCGIGYLQDYGVERVDITKPFIGGGSCWSVGFAELKPITEPVMLLRVELTDATNDIKRLRQEMKLAKRREARLRFALGQIKAAADLAADSGSGADHG